MQKTLFRTIVCLDLHFYPELWQLPTPGEKERYLKSLVKSYLLKDIIVVRLKMF